MTPNTNSFAEVSTLNRDTRGGGTWADVAVAVWEALQQSSPIVLTVAVGPRDILQIDIPRRSYEWATPLDEFPRDATGLTIVSNPAADPSPSPYNLDGLLWALGNNAFKGAPASWLPEGNRVRLSRWPNMPRHLHTMQQMYMLAALGNAHFSAAELAMAAKSSEAVAQDLINALSLMQLLRYSSTVPPVVFAEAAPKKSENLSLFARLRARLGR